MLGLVLARLPGRPLETYTDHATRKDLADCEKREEGLAEFFGGLVPKKAGDATALAEGARAQCAALALRPLAWDLTALTLQWEGKERDISVTKVESVDPERHTYRAAVRFSGVDYLVGVGLGADGGRLRLRLFDENGRPAGLSVARNVAASAIEGTWKRSEPRTARTLAKGVDADADTNEKLVVAVAPGGGVTITHQLRRHVYATGHKLACGGPVLDLGLEQGFSGRLEDGSIVAFRQKDVKSLGADTGRCWSLFTYSPDQATVLKLAGGKLLMARTDGVAFPETAEFQR
jgi:hypothetical protein